MTPMALYVVLSNFDGPKSSIDNQVVKLAGDWSAKCSGQPLPDTFFREFS
jgi:hypothetical protein